jgi:hypothetical protein
MFAIKPNINVPIIRADFECAHQLVCRHVYQHHRFAILLQSAVRNHVYLIHDYVLHYCDAEYSRYINISLPSALYYVHCSLLACLRWMSACGPTLGTVKLFDIIN